MQTITLYTENSIGILEKVINVLTRNRVNIEHLFVSTLIFKELNFIAISASISLETAQKLLPQFNKIIEVSNVQLATNIKKVAELSLFSRSKSGPIEAARRR